MPRSVMPQLNFFKECSSSDSHQDVYCCAIHLHVVIHLPFCSLGTGLHILCEEISQIAHWCGHKAWLKTLIKKDFVGQKFGKLGGGTTTTL